MSDWGRQVGASGRTLSRIIERGTGLGFEQWRTRLRIAAALAALANGWTNLQIAARIGISANTVKYHLKNLYDKLGVNNRAMAVAMFMSVSRDHR